MPIISPLTNGLTGLRWGGGVARLCFPHVGTWRDFNYKPIRTFYLRGHSPNPPSFAQPEVELWDCWRSIAPAFEQGETFVQLSIKVTWCGCCCCCWLLYAGWWHNKGGVRRERGRRGDPLNFLMSHPRLVPLTAAVSPTPGGMRTN